MPACALCLTARPAPRLPAHSGDCNFCAAPRCEEQFCGKCTYTYNSKHAVGTLAQGGYSTSIVVRDTFVLRIPDNLPLDAAAPLLCAGITGAALGACG